MPTPIINSQLDDITQSLINILGAINNLPFAGVPEAVSDWLTDHPEATTTVQDGAITLAKLANDVKLPTKYVVQTVTTDAGNSGSVTVGCDFNVYDEMTFVIFQSDTTEGTTWSDGNVSYLTLRDSSSGSATGYIDFGDSIIKNIIGSKSVVIKAKRIPDAIIVERIVDGITQATNVIPRDPSYIDHINWFSLNANTGKVLKTGAKIICMVGRV